MTLPSVKDLLLQKKTVLLRANYDVPLKNGAVADATRIEESLPTIKYLLLQQAKIIIISHLGRPNGKIVPELSLKPIEKRVKELLGKDLILLENLRFNPGEEANDPVFAQRLATLADFYVNEAFGCSHRLHTSIVGIPRFLKSVFGLSFLKEVEILSRVRENPKRPLVLILGGAKSDKIKAAKKLVNWADEILLGGKLAKCGKDSGKDISLEMINKFKKVISGAATIIWSGPMGAFEDKRFAKGTKEIAQAIIGSKAFSVAGGGDTEAALSKLGLEKKIGFVSSGGGAMLEFLANGTLPGIEAVLGK